MNLQRFLSLKYTYYSLGKLIPILSVLCVLCMLYGVAGGLYLAPSDYQQGDAFRIIYLHVPAALWSLGIYSIIFVSSIVFLVWRIKLADLVAKSSASIGAIYTLLALLTGAIWGKPMWGTWWIWDARLTSELILLFLYFGYVGLRSAIPDPKRAAKAAALLAIVGMIDIPIIHFSVEWWTTLHQGPTLSRFARPAMVSQMLYPLLSMISAFFFFYATLLCIGIRTNILRQEWRTQWIREWLQGEIAT